MWTDTQGNKVEDNVIAFAIMDEYPDLTPKALYQKLEEAYTND